MDTSGESVNKRRITQTQESNFDPILLVFLFLRWKWNFGTWKIWLPAVSLWRNEVCKYFLMETRAQNVKWRRIMITEGYFFLNESPFHCASNDTKFMGSLWKGPVPWPPVFGKIFSPRSFRVCVNPENLLVITENWWSKNRYFSQHTLILKTTGRTTKIKRLSDGQI